MKTIRFLLMLVCGVISWQLRAEPSLNTIVASGVLEPYGVTADADASNYYLTDSTHCVLKYSTMSGQLSVIAGIPNAQGHLDGLGLFAGLNAPRGIIFYNNTNAANTNCLIVADSGNHTIRLIANLNQEIVTIRTIAGQPGINGLATDAPFATNALFNNPVGLATDGVNIFVADTKNNAVRRLAPTPTPTGINFSVNTLSTGFFEPSALAVGSRGQIFVADTRNHAIKVLEPQLDGTYTLVHLAGSTNGVSGMKNDLFATNALFNMPSGLVWQDNSQSLLVSDTGNNVLRRVYFDKALSDFLSAYLGVVTEVWPVETFAGTGQPGKVDGPLKTAQFRSPAQIYSDGDQGTLVADTGNNAIRRVQVNEAQPQVTQPVIGYVTWVENPVTGTKISKLVPIKDVTFDHFTGGVDPIIAILGEGSTIFYTEGITPDLLANDTIPDPEVNNGQPAPPYQDGLPYGTRINSIMSSAKPDWTFKTRGIAKGRRPSDLYIARIQFKVAAPYFASDNPAALEIECSTADASMWYTLDGSTPVPFAATSFGPISTGVSINIADKFTNSITIRVRGFAAGFQDSEISTKELSRQNYKANKITFGFDSGEASSVFKCAPGQWFQAPITLSLLPMEKMYSLQFGVLVTNVNSAPIVSLDAYGFRSMLLRAIIPPYYEPIEPGMDFGGLAITNSLENLLMVGWLQRPPFDNNLYDSSVQDLITFSQPHDTLFLSSAGKVVVGSYKFQVPISATNGQKYRIQIIRPSATADGVSRDVYIDTPTNGSLGAGPINAIKEVTVESIPYIVGDIAPFRWFNAGDFGDGYLLNNDVMQVYQEALSLFIPALIINQAPLNSDFRDAMDSSDAMNRGGIDTTLAMVTNGTDIVINSMTKGDGQIDVTDIYVTYRRSLDPGLKWFRRYWTNGVQNVEEVPNTFRGQPMLAGERVTATSAALPPEAVTIMASTNPPSVSFFAGDIQGVAGQTLQAAIWANIAGPHPIRVLAMSLEVTPLDGSPALTDPIQFTAASDLGEPTYSRMKALNAYGATWLSTTTPGIWGSNALGVLTINVPTNAVGTSAYRITFKHISSSPNGLCLFPQEVRDGLLTLNNRSGSSWGDGIPDTWRLRCFGSISNLLSHADADADGDGVSNRDEFRAGTNPADVKSALRMISRKHRNAALTNKVEGITLRWPSVSGKHYILEWIPSLSETNWIPLNLDIPGSGQLIEVVDPDNHTDFRVYRVRVSE